MHVRAQKYGRSPLQAPASGPSFPEELQPENRLSCQGVRLHYRERGQGRAIVLLHGFGASSFTWRRFLRELSEDHRVIAPDLKGFGLSDKPPGARYSPDHQADLLLDLIRLLGLKDVVLAGHSFGGTVALLAALKLQDRAASLLSGLILLDAAAYVQDPPAFLRILRTPVINRLTLSLLPSTCIARNLLKQSMYRPGKLSAEIIRGYSAPLRLPGAHRAVLEAAGQLVPPEAEAWLARYGSIPVPARLVWGAQDTVIPLRFGHRLAQDIPAAELTVFDACGHMPHEERPAETVAISRRFLRQI